MGLQEPFIFPAADRGDNNRLRRSVAGGLAASFACVVLLVTLTLTHEPTPTSASVELARVRDTASEGRAATMNRDTVGGPGSPLAKQVVVGMDTNVNLHVACNDWENWSKQMEPYWTDDCIYDFNYVGEWGFGPSHGLRAWFDGEHEHFNSALPDAQWTDFIRAANDVNATSASYGLARWTGPFAGVEPPPEKPWVKIHDTDFYLLEGDRIKVNWCIIDVVDMFAQAGYHVLPPAPMPTDGFRAPVAMDGFPAPLSAMVKPEDTAQSTKVWRAAITEDYLQSTGGASRWADKMIWYGPGGIGTAHSRQDYIDNFLNPLKAGLSNRSLETDLLICEGGYCGAHFYVYGDHTGEWLGEQPTGKRIPLRCAAHAHVQGGEIIEGWLVIDIPRAFNAMGVDLYGRARMLALNSTRRT